MSATTFATSVVNANVETVGDISLQFHASLINIVRTFMCIKNDKVSRYIPTRFQYV